MMKMLKILLTSLIGLSIVSAAFLILLLNQAFKFWLQQPRGDEQVVFEVEEGDGLSVIAETLKSDGLIANAFWFKVYTKLDGSARSIQAGVFALQSHMNYASIVDVLIDADSEEVTITFPEGYTIEQMGELVTKELEVTKTEWALATGLESPLENHPFVVAADKPENVDLEGYLFPSTYRFFKNATAEDVALVMLEEMEEQAQKAGIRDQLSVDVQTVHEALTLASIVEREVRAPDEMATVSGIFYNRLDIGMALQADSTVNYFTGKDTPSVSISDTEIDSPYNTYLYSGLPPGPISNPGFNALKAVADPAATDYVYFLTSPEGDVHYATTFDEHITNRNLYLR